MSDSGPYRSLNPSLRGMGHSATVAINERSNRLRESGREVFKLGLGQSPFPVPGAVVASLQEHAHQKDYLDVRGLRALRDAVAGYHASSEGIERSGEHVLIGPGSKELMFLLQLAYDGVLIVPSPSWVSYEPQARILGQRTQWLMTHRSDGWRLTPEGLDAVCREERARPRLMILNYPSNPSGASYTAEQLEGLAKVAREHRILMLSDEIYGEVHHTGEHVSIARFYPEGTVISSGLSKWCGAGGWRLGHVSFPKELDWLCQAMGAAASETFTTTSAPIQYAAVAAYSGNADVAEYVRRSRRVLRALCRWCVDRLMDAGAQCGDPVGGFYLFPDFSSLRERLAEREISSSPSFCEKLLEVTGVAILPGSCFGRPANELTTRLAFVDFDGEAALEGVAQLGDAELGDEFVRKYCDRVVRAVEALCGWLAA